MQRTLMSILIAIVLVLVSCEDKSQDGQIAARVGESVLLMSEVRMQVPIGMTGIDSTVFAKDYIDAWVDEHMLYEKGLQNLPNVSALNQQAEEYRQNLIAQNYENELLRTRVSASISDDETQAFYEKYSKKLKLEHPVVQGVYVKLPVGSSKVSAVRNWMKALEDGKDETLADIDQYGNERASEYENFYDVWIDMYHLTDKLPVTVVDDAAFLRRKAYEMKDDDSYYMFMIRDFRLSGDIAPYDFIKPDIQEILIQQRWQDERRRLIEDLKSDGLNTGFVKINN